MYERVRVKKKNILKNSNTMNFMMFKKNFKKYVSGSNDHQTEYRISATSITSGRMETFDENIFKDKEKNMAVLCSVQYSVIQLKIPCCSVIQNTISS